MLYVNKLFIINSVKLLVINFLFCIHSIQCCMHSNIDDSVLLFYLMSARIYLLIILTKQLSVYQTFDITTFL